MVLKRTGRGTWEHLGGEKEGRNVVIMLYFQKSDSIEILHRDWKKN